MLFNLAQISTNYLYRLIMNGDNTNDHLETLWKNA